MSQDFERIQSRLNNIRSVGPILAALRTISLGSWQMALNRLRGLRDYSARLLSFLPLLLPHIAETRHGQPFLRGQTASRGQVLPATERVIALVIGSERGLCGQYNAVIAARAATYFAAQAQDGVALEIMALGSRMIRTLQRQKRALHWAQSLPVTRLPAFETAFSLTREWLLRYEASEIDAVDVLYNAYDRSGRYTPTVFRLLPPDLPSAASLAPEDVSLSAPYIIETDPLRMYVRIVEQWMAINFYTLLLSAAASEHSARFQLMESATQNVDRLVEDLTQELQSARRQAITIEMQELASSAGLLGKELRPEV